MRLRSTAATEHWLEAIVRVPSARSVHRLQQPRSGLVAIDQFAAVKSNPISLFLVVSSACVNVALQNVIAVWWVRCCSTDTNLFAGPRHRHVAVTRFSEDGGPCLTRRLMTRCALWTKLKHSIYGAFVRANLIQEKCAPASSFAKPKQCLLSFCVSAILHLGAHNESGTSTLLAAVSCHVLSYLPLDKLFTPMHQSQRAPATTSLFYRDSS